MNRAAAFVLPLAAMLCLSSAARAAGDKVLVKSTFDSTLDGWTSNTPAEVQWNASGGNPGGEALFTNASGSTSDLIAPVKFLAPAVNYAKLDGKAYFSWQHLLVTETGVTGGTPFEIRLFAPGGIEAKFDGGIATVSKKNKWLTAVAPLVGPDWTVTGGTWSDLLANVQGVEIDIELINNGSGSTDIEAVDNIALVSHPAGFSPK